MADLNLVQVRTLVDETDIGKIQPGPARDGHGRGLSQPAVPGHGAQDRAAGADRAERHHVPGAGADRQPRGTAAARHERRGRDPHRPARRRARGAERRAPHPARRRLRGAGARPRAPRRCSRWSPQRRRDGADTATASSAAPRRRPDATVASGARPGGRDRGRGPARADAAGAPGAGAGGAPAAAAPAPAAGLFGGRYIVFVRAAASRRPSGSAPASPTSTTAKSSAASQPTDSVLLLPSASLVQSQQEMRERINRFTGGGAVPGMQQQTGRSGPARSGARQR